MRDVRTGVGIPVSQTSPIANADSVTTPEDTPVSDFNVLANDSDPDGQADLAAAVIASVPAAGATPPTYKVNGVCTALTAANNPVIGSPSKALRITSPLGGTATTKITLK